MLDEDPIVDPEDVHHDPVRGCPEPRKTPVNDHELLVGNDRSWLVLQRWRDALDEIEQAIATGRDMSAVLDVVGRPKLLLPVVVC